MGEPGDAVPKKARLLSVELRVEGREWLWREPRVAYSGCGIWELLIPSMLGKYKECGKERGPGVGLYFRFAIYYIMIKE